MTLSTISTTQNLEKEKPPTIELYSLRQDPTETTNVADMHPKILQKAAEVLGKERDIPE